MSANPPSLSRPVNDSVDQRDPFRPSWVFRNGHIQTLVGTYVFGRWPDRRQWTVIQSTKGEVAVCDGDRLAFQDDCPEDWRPGQVVALLAHGLAGSYVSPYMSRAARKLNRRGVRTFRLDWRGCGAGIALARYPYHSGRSTDLLAAVNEVKARCPGSPICVIGFSMGGNIALKLLGEAGAVENGTAGIARAVSVCPPIDLTRTVEFLRKGLARWYDAYFTKTCIRSVRQRHSLRPDSIIPDGWFSRLPRTMREFDETFTAPICGFASGADYYLRSSADQFLPTISVPTLLIVAQDDPVIPYGQFVDARYSPAIQLRAPKHGGHVGFINAGGPDWLDRQIVEWTINGV